LWAIPAPLDTDPIPIESGSKSQLAPRRIADIDTAQVAITFIQSRSDAIAIGEKHLFVSLYHLSLAKTIAFAGK